MKLNCMIWLHVQDTYFWQIIVFILKADQLIKLVNGVFRILPGELIEEFPAKDILASYKTL